MAKRNLREWAVKGAEQRLVELADEARAIFAAFPSCEGKGAGDVKRGRAVAPQVMAHISSSVDSLTHGSQAGAPH